MKLTDSETRSVSAVSPSSSSSSSFAVQRGDVPSLAVVDTPVLAAEHLTDGRRERHLEPLCSSSSRLSVNRQWGGDEDEEQQHTDESQLPHGESLPAVELLHLNGPPALLLFLRGRLKTEEEEKEKGEEEEDDIPCSLPSPGQFSLNSERERAELEPGTEVIGSSVQLRAPVQTKCLAGTGSIGPIIEPTQPFASSSSLLRPSLSAHGFVTGCRRLQGVRVMMQPWFWVSGGRNEQMS